MIELKISEIVAKHGYTWLDVISNRREKDLILCRQSIASALRHEGLSYPAIGKIMNRDHASIMHLIAPGRKQRNNANARANHLRIKMDALRPQ